ncbi:tRNA glutamyl-Q(34) synthetase GluQRS [Sphingomicrobium flavum]|uniref:tRNA glutamyl-Q(34) synthetase GluQRS n=1 Tax=Sphingomicrobium flavum TaxID=1229164 RepID=UPI0021ADF027|nr:tRNA glutamyl-Q(34) synthetase GluQRS [Sphingomicrobium flavum]
MPATRFAPSPSGQLHLGHAYSAATAHRLAREMGGEFKLRIDDLDPGRSKAEFVDTIFEDLEWLGLQWDGEVIHESHRLARYDAALADLQRQGLVYPCFCTRSDIQQALTAPHGDPGAHYPGTCRDLPDDPARRQTTPHSWRLDTDKALQQVGALPSWTESDGRQFTASRSDLGDAILARKDSPSSYHLACVLDDMDQGVTMVVRGADLRPSTPIQRLLQTLLALPEPAYHHHLLVTFEDGRRLAKRDHAPTLKAMREDGVDGHALARRLMDQSLPLGFRLSQPT